MSLILTYYVQDFLLYASGVLLSGFFLLVGFLKRNPPLCLAYQADGALNY